MTSTASHTAACGHSTDVPSQLCPGCTRHLGQTLGRMTQLHQALAAWLAPGSRRPEHGTARAVDAPLPVREQVLSLRGPGGIVGLLEDWLNAIHDARGFNAPTRAGDIPARIHRAAAAIQRNLTWVSLTWEQGPALAREIRQAENQVLAVIDPPEHSVPLGPCPAIIDGDQTCGTTLRVPPGTTHVECRRCHAVYPPHAWLQLRAWMNEDQQDAERKLAS
jgi:LSD1 subclass zinc finger protein